VLKRTAIALAGLAGLALAATQCKPKTVAEAEARGDVAWLQQNDSPPASAALGRLADKDPRAVTALTLRSAYDLEAFRAAWDAVIRHAPWGTALIHDGLLDPKRADRAASVMTATGGHLPEFLPDLEAALVRLSATPQNVNVASALAAVGPSGHDAVERRLIDASTRPSMCVGVASPRASDDARNALLGAPYAARDALTCVEAVVQVAADDEAALEWLATKGETGLLGAAGKSAAMPCAVLHVAWVQAFAARPASDYAALTVPLGYAVMRCAPQMDGVLADVIAHMPAAHAVVVAAIDPFASYADGLRATCAALPTIAGGPDAAVVRERASDALMHACKPPG
jgi:hypothetical protein